MFHNWSTRLHPHIEAQTIRLPGRETRRREPSITRMDELVQTLLEALDSEWNGVFGFFGHSMGARVAFELTRALHRSGRTLPRHLFVSASRAPHIGSRRRPVDELSDAELAAELRDLGTPQMIFDDPDVLAMYLPVVRTDLALLDAYVYEPGPALPVPLFAFGGESDPVILHDELAAWAAYTTERFELAQFPGGHLYLKSDSSDALLARIAAAITHST